MQLNNALGPARATRRKRASSATLCVLAVALVIGFTLVFADAVRSSAVHWHQDPNPTVRHFPG